jgi:hypothetical protein
MIALLVGVALLTIGLEWLAIFIATKTKLIDKFLPKQDAKNSYVQFKAGGIDAHFEGNIADAVKSIGNFFFPDETMEQRVDNRINNAINRNTDKIIDAMLSNKNVQKQMQKQIFAIVKDKLNAQVKNDKKASK